jgi:uncharacterized protein (DUF2141 family)
MTCRANPSATTLVVLAAAIWCNVLFSSGCRTAKPQTPDYSFQELHPASPIVLPSQEIARANSPATAGTKGQQDDPAAKEQLQTWSALPQSPTDNQAKSVPRESTQTVATQPVRPTSVPMSPTPAIAGAGAQVDNDSAELVIKGIQFKQGTVRVAVFSRAEDFPLVEKASQTMNLETTSSTVRTSLAPAEQVAIAVFQDLNSDGQLNRNRLGIPVEPYAFSNNVRGNRGPPSFEQAVVAITAGLREIVITLP